MADRYYLGNLPQGFCAEDAMQHPYSLNDGLLTGLSGFKYIRTHYFLAIYVLLLAAFEVFMFLDLWKFPKKLDGPYFDFKFKLNASIHTFFVILSFLLAKCMKKGHKSQKRQGYIRLHSKLKPYVNFPVVVVVLGECMFITWGVWIRGSNFDVNDALKAIVGLELVLLFVFFVDYSRILLKHNMRKLPPDALTALKEMGSDETPLMYAIGHDLGLDSVTDEQAELIRFLQQRTTQLSKQVLKLQAKLDQSVAVPRHRVESPHRSPEFKTMLANDMEHIVASKDREIRALNAERDSLQRELRDGKKRLMDFNKENQQLHSTNQQHVAENARLRAIIHEWSVRHAKLEARLQNGNTSTE